ncbi:MAG: hypothetical protein ACFE9D_12010 [Promethearchaeota archaeon]
MLTPKKCQHGMQLLVSLGLLFLLAVGFFIPINDFHINDTRSYLQSYQKPNEPNLQKYGEGRDSSEQRYYETQNCTVEISRTPPDQSQYWEPLEIGYQRNFWICDFAISVFYEIGATLLSMGEYSLVFMENSCITELGELVAISRTETIRDEFDSTIYPRITDLAGHPNGTLGDIDGDPRIIILLANCANYYTERNELPFDYSNLCEMIYLHYRIPTMQVFAHEFHHLIWFNNEWDEPQFILEALAQYAMYYAGYLEPHNNLAPQVPAYLSHPEDSLLYWNLYNEGGVSSVIDYGSAYLFAFYIAEKYGVDILRDLIKESTDGPPGIEAVLQTAGNDIMFNELYLNWITALTIDALGFCNNLYGFENLDAQITHYSSVGSLPFLNERIPLRYYGFHIHKIQFPTDNITVQITKSSNETIGISIASHDAFGWHIYQELHDQEETLITKNISGYQIDVAYIITSYMLNYTPTIIRSDDIGLGPLTHFDISIIPTQTTWQVPWELIITLSGICGLFLFITIVFILSRRNNFEEKIA